MYQYYRIPADVVKNFFLAIFRGVPEWHVTDRMAVGIDRRRRASPRESTPLYLYYTTFYMQNQALFFAWYAVIHFALIHRCILVIVISCKRAARLVRHPPVGLARCVLIWTERKVCVRANARDYAAPRAPKHWRTAARRSVPLCPIFVADSQRSGKGGRRCTANRR